LNIKILNTDTWKRTRDMILAGEDFFA